MVSILTVLMAYLPHHETVLRDHCTVTEINRYYRPTADGDELVFEQLIFWDWHGRPLCTERVVAWRISPGLRPEFDYARKLWVTRWRDSGRLREITADYFRETESYYDREIYDRQFLPPEHRRKLTE